MRKKREIGQTAFRKTIKPNEPLPKVEDNRIKLDIIIKGDVVGSVEAILDVLVTYRDHDKCLLSIIEHEVGHITETDVEMAKLFNGANYYS